MLDWKSLSAGRTCSVRKRIHRQSFAQGQRSFTHRPLRSRTKFYACDVKYESDTSREASDGSSGFVFNQLGSPFGHTYQTLAGASVRDSIVLPTGVTAEQAADRRSGTTEYRYQTLTSPRRGAAALGAYLHQAQVGHVYAPLTLEASNSGPAHHCGSHWQEGVFYRQQS